MISFRVVNTTFQNCFGYAIIGSNIQENSLFKNVKILQDNVTLSGHVNGILQLSFQDEYSQETHINISGCNFNNIILHANDYNVAAVHIDFSQQNYPAEIQIVDTSIVNITSNNGPLVGVTYSSRNNNSNVMFINSDFVNNSNVNHSTIEINILSIKQIDIKDKNISQNKNTKILSQIYFFLINCRLHNNTSHLKSILNVYGPTVENNINVSFTFHISTTVFTYNKAKEGFSKVETRNIASHFVISKCNFTSNKRFGLEFKAIKYLEFDGPNTFYRNLAVKFALFFDKSIPLFREVINFVTIMLAL